MGLDDEVGSSIQDPEPSIRDEVPSYVEQTRKQHPRAYEKWSDEEDERLREAYEADAKVKDLAADFARKPGAIRSRLKKLGLS